MKFNPELAVMSSNQAWREEALAVSGEESDRWQLVTKPARAKASPAGATHCRQALRGTTRGWWVPLPVQQNLVSPLSHNDLSQLA